jgi:putative glutamine amidotransferase
VSRPFVGICAAVEQARFGAWDQPAVLLPFGYSEAVQAAGGIAVLLPPDDSLVDAPGEVLSSLDALMLAGGRDLDPLTYGASPDPYIGETSPERDRFELAMLSAALERDMPVLGVCRGMEMLNVACGGTLVQHLTGELLERHRHTPGVFSDHSVELTSDSVAARAAGVEVLHVRSHHHQAIDELGEGLVVSGNCPADGLVEALELPDKRFALGVLWHPEEDARSGVIGALVRAASSATRPVPLPQMPG